MRILLINPPPFAIVEPWYDTPKFVRPGLAYLAGYLRQYPGFEIMIIDAKFERLSFEQTLERVLEFKPDLVGLTAFTNEIKPAAHMAEMIKAKLPNAVTVIGGVHMTALPERTMLEFPQFDIGVIGEGEVTFFELCSAIRDLQPINDVKGIAFRLDDKVEITPPRERILDEDSIPFPAWDLLPRAESYLVMTLRGCPFNCVFCMNPNGRVARKRSIENVIEELELITNRYHPKEIMFADELFSVDLERCKALLYAMIEHDIHKRVGWWAQTHVKFADYELFALMKKANVIMVGLGIETGDEEILKTLGKGTSIEAIFKAREAARKAKVPINSYFIIGQPNETLESIEKTIKLAIKLNPELPIFGIMVPYPGTEVARLAALGEGGYRLVTTDWDEYNKQIGGALEFANLTRSQIEWIQIKAYIKVFLYNHRYIDFVKFAWHYRRGGWSVLKKALFKTKAIGREVHVGQEQAHLRMDQTGIQEIARATTNWQKWQRSEMDRMKKINPTMLKVVQRKNENPSSAS